MAVIPIFFWNARADLVQPEPESGQWLFGRRAHQCDCVSVANKFRQLRVVAKPQREHVAGATEDDRFPPPVVQAFLSDDEMPRRDLIPCPGQAGRDRQFVVVFADRGMWFDRERHDDLAVQALPDIRHEAATVTVQPALRQLFGKGGQVFAGCFINFEVHELGGLGKQFGIGGRKPRRPRFVVLVIAEDDERDGQECGLVADISGSCQSRNAGSTS